ncbi:hypothetical protein NQ176_g1034 [Zarea fungicola]|uniref:Uncharacterized protein n=1 Tax=Zarea fungicola TaxID=93591 RepID=A0ACC1NUZ9_9HYPO|nr:hypothetical protein NQ176_g1034 [Lecanicillium fungicola]
MGNPMTAGYNIPPPAQNARAIANPAQSVHHTNAYNPPRPPEVYTLPDNVNEALPAHIRSQFQRDSAGRVLFFTAPPADRQQNRLSLGSGSLTHSLRYLAGHDEWRIQREKKRKIRDQLAAEPSSKRTGMGASTKGGNLIAEAVGAVNHWLTEIGRDTEKWKQETGLTH